MTVRSTIPPALAITFVAALASFPAVADCPGPPSEDCPHIRLVEQPYLPLNYQNRVAVRWYTWSDEGEWEPVPIPDSYEFDVYRSPGATLVPFTVESGPGGPYGQLNITVEDASPGTYDLIATSGSCQGVVQFGFHDEATWPVQPLPRPQASWWVRQGDPNGFSSNECQDVPTLTAGIDIDLQLPEAWHDWQHMAEVRVFVADDDFAARPVSYQESGSDGLLQERVSFACGDYNPLDWPSPPEGEAMVAVELRFLDEPPVRTPRVPLTIDCFDPPEASEAGCSASLNEQMHTALWCLVAFGLAVRGRRRASPESGGDSARRPIENSR